VSSFHLSLRSPRLRHSFEGSSQQRRDNRTGYGEIFERNVGQKSVLGLPRGGNNLWSKGGIVSPMPIR